MSKGAKLARPFGAGLGILLAILLIALILAPRIINLESIKGKIEGEASRIVKGTVEYEKVELSILPRPRAVIKQARISIPGVVDGTIESLSANPEMLPILTGKVRISSLRIEKPDVTLRLPDISGKEKKKEEPFTQKPIEEKAAALFSSLSEQVPGLLVNLEGGKLKLIRDEESLFSFEDLNGKILLPPEGFTVDISCTSNLWERLSVTGRLDEKDLTGGGKVELMKFNPRILTAALFPKAPLGVDETELNLSLGFITDKLTAFHGQVSGSSPALTLQRGKKRARVKGISFQGSYHIGKGKVGGTISKLQLDQPGLTLSGGFLQDKPSSRVELNLEARDLKAGEAREKALALAGEIPTVQDIFEIVNSGNVPLITFRSEGKRVADLGNLENMHIEATMNGGKISIPGVELNLTDAGGKVVITGGILTGKNLHGRLGKSRGEGGTLRLDLEGEKTPFHLEISANADLAELKPLLTKLIEDETFDRQVSLLHDLTGGAKGRIVLGERLDAIEAKVTISELNLSTRYEPVPYPLEIMGGDFSYDPSGIGVSNLRGRVGKSSFSGLTGAITFEKSPSLSVSSGKVGIILDEAYRWLSSLEGMSDKLKRIKNLKGIANLSISRLDGPLASPDKWNFETKAEVVTLSVDTSFLPGSLEVTGGTLEANTEKISFNHLKTDFLDASLDISGNVKNYRKGIQGIETDLNGTVGAKATGWIAKRANLPDDLAFRTPILFTETLIAWDRTEGSVIRGNLTPRDGPAVSFSFRQSPEELKIEKLTIKDNESDATISVALKKRALKIAFAGDLTKKTLDALFLDDRFPIGWIKGDFRTTMLLDQPMASTAEGNLEGENIVVPWKKAVPLKFEKFSLGTGMNRVNIHSAVLLFGENRLSAKGNVSFSEEEVLFDMDVSSDGIDWAEINRIIGEGDEKKHGKSGDNEREKEGKKRSWDVPIKGTVNLTSDYFTYERFTWKDLSAAITLDKESVDMAVKEGILCGVSTPGVLKVTPQELSIDFRLEEKDRDLYPTITCIADKTKQVTGRLDLRIKTAAQGKKEALLKSLQGNVDIVARDGKISQLDEVAKIFSYLNVTGIIKGELPDMKKEGFTYKSVTIKGDLQDGKLQLKEAVIDSSAVKLVGHGYIDYVDEKVKLTVLVAPLTGVSSIIKRLPLVGSITGGTLISIPVEVSGDLSDPKIKTLSASAVGSSAFGLMKRVIGAPVKVVEPIVPGGSEETEGKP